MSRSETILTTKSLTVGYTSAKGDKEVLEGLDLTLRSGELTCLLGPNGSGKSTLIRTLAKIQQPINGEIDFMGRPLESFTQKSLAKNLSMVLTDRTTPGNLTGYALVSLGRFPYTSWMGTLRKTDLDQIQWAMEVTGSMEFANTHIGELSDGERQKVMIARALAQDTPIIFLDEPTAHLDLPNRLEIFHLLGELAHESNKAILLSSHELDTAISSADQLWLINGNTVKKGIPEDLVIAGILEDSFTKENLKFDYLQGQFKRKHIKKEAKVIVKGSGVLLKWMHHALERSGFEITHKTDAEYTVRVEGDRSNPSYTLENNETTYTTFEQLLTILRK